MAVVQVPYDSGHRGRRMGAGPLRIVEAGLLGALAGRGAEARLASVDLDTDFPTEIDSGFRVVRAVKDRVEDAVSEGRFPLLLAGNCMGSLGALAALVEPTVFWFDAHGDLNTPETTRSGFLDGMALSILMGRCWRPLAAEAGVVPVPEERIHLVGARELDPAEDEFLASSSVHQWDGAEAGPAGDGGGGICYLHIDLDVLDPTVGRANWYSAPGGLSVEGLLGVVERIAERHRIGGLALTAYDPSADGEGRIAAAAIRIAGEVVDLAAAGGRVSA